MKSFLKILTESFGPSGYEEIVSRLIFHEVRSLTDEVRIDAIGNVIARRKPSREAKNTRRIMLAAHMDETGVIASHIDKSGFIRFAYIGGTLDRNIQGVRVRFSNGITGVIGYDRLEQVDDLLPIGKMFIDVGERSRADCPVKVGDVAAFEGPYFEMGDRLVAKAMDGRAGVAILVETLRKLKSTAHDVHFVFTTQKQVGMRGAGPVTFGIEPEIGIAVDVTSAGDTPGASTPGVELGKGPCIRIRDEQMLPDRRVVSWMLKTAEKARIPHQREVLLSGSSEAKEIQISRAGVMTGVISVPVRYLHSSSEMVDYNDLKNSVALLIALLRTPASLKE